MESFCINFKSLALIFNYILSRRGGFQFLLIWSNLESIPQIPPLNQILLSKHTTLKLHMTASLHIGLKRSSHFFDRERRESDVSLT